MDSTWLHSTNAKYPIQCVATIYGNRISNVTMAIYLMEMDALTLARLKLIINASLTQTPVFPILSATTQAK